MIKERYVPFELAKLLKEKGFDVHCNAFYMRVANTRKMSLSNVPNTWNDVDGWCSAPTYQMVVDWLESKGIIISVIASSCQIDLLYEYEIIKLDKERFGYIPQKCEDNFSTRWDALEDAIKWCLNNI